MPISSGSKWKYYRLGIKVSAAGNYGVSHGTVCVHFFSMFEGYSMYRVMLGFRELLMGLCVNFSSTFEGYSMYRAMLGFRELVMGLCAYTFSVRLNRVMLFMGLCSYAFLWISCLYIRIDIILRRQDEGITHISH